jgi:hypothetical protein
LIVAAHEIGYNFDSVHAGGQLGHPIVNGLGVGPRQTLDAKEKDYSTRRFSGGTKPGAQQAASI